MKRIALGSPANPGDFPHQVSVHNLTTGHFRSDSIITNLLLILRTPTGLIICNLFVKKDQANISGWGLTQEESSSERGKGLRMADCLIVTQVSIVDRENCTAKWKRVDRTITDNMFCAGGAGTDACQGKEIPEALSHAQGMVFLERRNATSAALSPGVPLALDE